MNAAVAVFRQHGLKILIALAVLYFGGGYVYEHFIKSEEEKIRDQFRAAALGAVNRQAGEISRVLADNFKGPQGVDKDFAHSICVQIVMRYRVIEAAVLPEPIPVTVHPDDPRKATARFQIHLRGKVEDGFPWSEIGADYSEATSAWLKAQLVKTEQGWRIVVLERESEAGIAK
jgi:hypothetical protein